MDSTDKEPQTNITDRERFAKSLGQLVNKAIDLLDVVVELVLWQWKRLNNSIQMSLIAGTYKIMFILTVKKDQNDSEEIPQNQLSFFTGSTLFVCCPTAKHDIHILTHCIRYRHSAIHHNRIIQYIVKQIMMCDSEPSCMHINANILMDA